MVAPLEFAGALQRQQIAGIRHHTDHAVAALGVAADLTFRISGEVETGLALAHLGAGRQQSVSELMNLLLRLVQQMQREPLGRARADAGQTLELINQSSQRFGEAAQGSAADAGNVGVAEIICRNRGHDHQATTAEWPVD